MDRKLGRRVVNCADHLLYCLTVGRKRRRMLILAAQVEGRRPGRSCMPTLRLPGWSPRRKDGHSRWSESGQSDTVIERCACDTEVTRIQAVDPDIRSAGAAPKPEFVGKFGFERQI